MWGNGKENDHLYKQFACLLHFDHVASHTSQQLSDYVQDDVYMSDYWQKLFAPIDVPAFTYPQCATVFPVCQPLSAAVPEEKSDHFHTRERPLVTRGPSTIIPALPSCPTQSASKPPKSPGYVQSLYSKSTTHARDVSTSAPRGKLLEQTKTTCIPSPRKIRKVRHSITTRPNISPQVPRSMDTRASTDVDFDVFGEIKQEVQCMVDARNKWTRTHCPLVETLCFEGREGRHEEDDREPMHGPDLREDPILISLDLPLLTYHANADLSPFETLDEGFASRDVSPYYAEEMMSGTITPIGSLSEKKQLTPSDFLQTGGTALSPSIFLGEEINDMSVQAVSELDAQVQDTEAATIPRSGYTNIVMYGQIVPPKCTDEFIRRCNVLEEHLFQDIISQAWMYACYECHHLSSTASDLRKHYAHIHPDHEKCFPFMCIACPDRFTTAKLLRRHISTVHAHMCLTCRVIYANAGELNVHVDAVHNEKSMCKICDKQFTR